MENQERDSTLISKLLIASTVVAFSASFFKKVWTWENKIPFHYWKQYDTFEFAARCAGLSTIIIFLQLFVIMISKLFSSTSNKIQGHKNDFLVISKSILMNLLVENFLFVANILAAATNGLGNERIVIIFLVHFMAQALFWLGYLLIYLLKIHWLCEPDFIFFLSFMNNVVLFAFNMKPLINIYYNL